MRLKIQTKTASGMAGSRGSNPVIKAVFPHLWILLFHVLAIFRQAFSTWYSSAPLALTYILSVISMEKETLLSHLHILATESHCLGLPCDHPWINGGRRVWHTLISQAWVICWWHSGVIRATLTRIHRLSTVEVFFSKEHWDPITRMRGHGKQMLSVALFPNILEEGHLQEGREVRL